MVFPEMPSVLRALSREIANLGSSVARSISQSSGPLLPSFARKNRVSPTVVKLSEKDLEGPGLMSATRPVPASVPSDFQGSPPLLPSFARKNRVSPTAVNRPRSVLRPSRIDIGHETVPASFSVPSDFQSSLPLLPSFARKNRVSPTAVRYWGGKSQLFPGLCRRRVRCLLPCHLTSRALFRCCHPLRRRTGCHQLR